MGNDMKKKINMIAPQLVVEIKDNYIQVHYVVMLKTGTIDRELMFELETQEAHKLASDLITKAAELQNKQVENYEKVRLG